MAGTLLQVEAVSSGGRVSQQDGYLAGVPAVLDVWLVDGMSCWAEGLLQHLQLGLEAVGHKDRATRPVDDLLECGDLLLVELLVLSTTQVRVIHVEEPSSDLAELPGEDCGVRCGDDLPSEDVHVGDEVILELLVESLDSCRQRNHDVVVGGRRGADAAVRRLGEAGALEQLVNPLGCTRAGVVLDHDAVRQLTTGGEIPLTISTERRAQTLAVVQQEELSPEVQQLAVGGRGTREAPDVGHILAELLRRTPPDRAAGLEPTELVDDVGLELPGEGDGILQVVPADDDNVGVGLQSLQALSRGPGSYGETEVRSPVRDFLRPDVLRYPLRRVDQDGEVVLRQRTQGGSSFA